MSNFDPQGRRSTNVPTGNYNIDLNSIMDLNFTPTTNTSNTMSPSSSTTAPLRPQVDEATLYKTAEVRMESAFSNLEKGNFQSGLDEIVETIRILSSFPNPELVKRELRMCTAYKLLFMLLLESKKSEDNVIKGALLSRILADIPVQPKHRLVCFRMAIRKNLQVRNYKTTARFIKIILPMNLQDRKQMEDNLKLCEDNHLQNFQKYPFVCPACSSSVDGGDTQCSNCNHRILYCCQTFQPIAQGFYLSCNFCESVFSNLVVSPQSRCALCLSGTLIVTEVPSTGVTAPSLINSAHMSRSLGNLPSMVANPPTTTPVPPLSPSAMSASQPRLPSMETSASFPTGFPTSATPPPIPTQNNWADFSNFPPQTTERRASISGLPTPPAATNSRANDRLSLRLGGPVPVMPVDTFKEQAKTAAPFVAPIVKDQAKTAAPIVAPIVKDQAKTAAPVVAPIVKDQVKTTPFVKDQAKAMMSNPKMMESIKQSIESKAEPPGKVPPPLPAKEPIPPSKSAPPELPAKPSSDSIFTPPNSLTVDVITFDQRARYTKLFAQADIDKDGFVNGDDAKKFFNDAMLPRKTLAQVWRLSDRQKRGKLDKEDFALAMHFTLCAIKSLDLPSATPSQFLNETIENLLEAKPVPIPIPGRKHSISEDPKSKPPVPEPDQGRIRSASVSTEPPKRKSSVSFAEPITIIAPTPNPPPPLPPKDDQFIAPVAPISDFPFEEDAPVAKPPPKLSIPPSPKVPQQVTPPTLPTKPTIPPKPIATPTPTPPPVTTTPPPIVEDKKVLSPSKSGGTIGRSGPPKLTVLPAALLPKPEPKIEAPVVETTTETHPTLVPPPTLTVPPMFNTPALPNVIVKEEKKAPEPPPAKWFNYTVEKQGKVPEKKDYLAELPHDIKIAVSFVNKLIKDAAFSECHDMLADAIKEYVTEDQLREFGEYYSTLPELNYCAALSAKQAELTVVFVPMYSSESNNQAKVWISEDKVSGLEFSELNEEAWAKEGAVEKHIIDQPKIVIKTDGKILEICSPKEEYEAMNDPKVPWVLEAGPERRMKAVYGKTLTSKEKKPSIVRKGKDGKKYYVFSQTSVNDYTRKIHPDAYVREYWMSDESHPYCYLLDRNGRRLSEEQYLELPNGDLEPLSNLSKATKKRKDLNKPIPNLEHFYISTVIPPETPSQASLLHTFRSQPTGTTTPDQKGYITAIVPRSDQSIVYMIEWEMLMRTTTLKPRYEGINYLKEVSPISEEERRNNVRASPIFNFDNLEFEKWLSKVGLIKGVTTFSEDLSFAKRAYLRVLELCTLVSPSSSFAASEIIISGKTDAIGINVLFVAILRASNIPARLLHRKNPPKATKSNREVVEEDPPVVQSQFYVEHIGWLVADLSLNARGRNPNFNPNNPIQLLSGFGVDDSKSVVTGVDGLNFVELPGLGHRILSLDGPTVLFEHKILSNNWLLTEVPNVNKP